MQRRDVLRLLGGIPLLAGFTPSDLYALGQRTHAALGRSPSAGLFDIHQMHTVAAVGERILPATDTPGAMAAECHRFTERIVADHYDAARQRRFLAGLVDIDRRARALRGPLFIGLSASDQDAVLGAIEADALAAGQQGRDTFWRDLKYLTLYGYYTSRIGIEEELKTVRFPGRFDGRMPIGEGVRG